VVDNDQFDIVFGDTLRDLFNLTDAEQGGRSRRLKGQKLNENDI
jgi:hypothetical protein